MFDGLELIDECLKCGHDALGCLLFLEVTRIPIHELENDTYSE